MTRASVSLRARPLPRQFPLEDDRTVGIPRDATLEIAGTKPAPDPFPRKRYQHAGQRCCFRNRAIRDLFRDQVLDADNL